MRYLCFCIAIIAITFGACKSDNKPSPQTDSVEKRKSTDQKDSEINTPAIDTDTLVIEKPVKLKPEQESIEEKAPEPIPKKVSQIKKKKKIVQRPKIVFEDMKHDFGELVQGETYSHKFKFMNTGNADLEIKSATASCGCTQPSFPFIGIAPGETGYIGVTYNSVGKEADQSATITVKTNEEDQSYVLHLTGSVVLPEEEKDMDSIKMKKDTIQDN